MKARTRKTRWLLITLVLGFLAAAGATFVLHQHSGRLLVSASGIVPAGDTPLQQTDTTAPVSGGDDLPAQAPAASDARGDGYTVADTYSSTARTDAANDFESTSYGEAAYTVGPRDGTQQQTDGPSSSGDTATHAQGAGGYFANNGYMAFDCGGLPGCGAGGSGINGGAYWPHHSQGSGSGPQTNNSGPPTNNPGRTTGNSNPGDPGAGDPGQKSDPSGTGSDPPGSGSDPSGPGSGHSAAAAPELDPATLGGALTLLLGSLAVVGGRRVRATL